MNDVAFSVRCCCGHVYGDHRKKEPHACVDCACVGFQRPKAKRVVVQLVPRSPWAKRFDVSDLRVIPPIQVRRPRARKSAGDS